MTTTSKPPPHIRKLLRDLQELEEDFPFIQVQQSILDDNESTKHIVLWHVKIMTNTIFMKDNIVELNIKFSEDYPFKQSTAHFIQKSSSNLSDNGDDLQQQRVLLVPVPLAHLLQFSQTNYWNPACKISNLLKELKTLLCGPVVTTVVHGHLLRQSIPVELRSLVMNYLISKPVMILTDTNIRYAVWLWTYHRNLAILRYGHISQWDTSRVTNMNHLFRGSTEFNDDISKWDVKNVTSMKGMFAHASSFNQPLDGWNVSNVRDMSGIFRQATAFNQSLTTWHTNISVEVAVSKCATSSATEFTIKSLFYGTYVYCNVLSTDTIWTVKKKYHPPLNGNAIDKTHVLFNGNRLDNDMTLEECGIERDAILHFIPVMSIDLEEHIQIMEKILCYEYNTHLVF